MDFADNSAVHLFVAAARAEPERTAVHVLGGDDVSYLNLANMALRVATSLRKELDRVASARQVCI